jgi:hypothetical protein
LQTPRVEVVVVWVQASGVAHSASELHGSSLGFLAMQVWVDGEQAAVSSQRKLASQGWPAVGSRVHWCAVMLHPSVFRLHATVPPQVPPGAENEIWMQVEPAP